MTRRFFFRKMICFFHEPEQVAAVFQAWASWTILEWLVHRVVGKERNPQVMVAILGLLFIALFVNSCRRLGQN